MDHLQQTIRAFGLHSFWIFITENLFLLGLVGGLIQFTHLSLIQTLAVSLIVCIIVTLLCVQLIISYTSQPLQALWQAILHLSPDTLGIPAPQIDKLKVGRELVTSLTAQVYQLAGSANTQMSSRLKDPQSLYTNFVAQNLPLPMIIMDSTETITYANQPAAHYIGISVEDLVGKNIYMVMDMSFPSEDTFDIWLKEVKNKSATAVNSWERVRMTVRDNHPARLFDLAAYYNKDNPDHNETMLVLFDHTKQYSQDDQAISFVALTVHELRTPLTLLRGYIEVFQEELEGKIDPELAGFMQKMQSQSEQLTAFVNNILNVARIEDDQLVLNLQEEDWSSTLKNAIDMLSLRAKVRGISLKCSIQKGMPTVGVDSLSIREVVSNLIDNAIKYSGESKTISITTKMNAEGLIETSVQDFGLGISSSILPNLFTKFYRDHRNRAQIGGTGLGLFLAKTIVAAHGGSIWVRSKENEGSTFTFTLVPYSQLTEDMKKSGDKDITRSAHGWIKNHSLYRR